MIRMLLVDDQEFVRQGLKTLLETKPDLQVVGEAENGKRSIEQLEMLVPLPDVVLMDIRMPVMDGVEATKQICQQFLEIKILVLTTFNDTQYVAEALRFGAKGYLMKDTPIEELAKAIRSIHQGYTQFGPGIMEKLLTQVATVESAQSPESSPEPSPELLGLTARERSVLRLIAAGENNREIAQALFLTEGTVRNYISNILSQLNLRDRTQAAIVANTFSTWLENSKLLDEGS